MAHPLQSSRISNHLMFPHFDVRKTDVSGGHIPTWKQPLRRLLLVFVAGLVISTSGCRFASDGQNAMGAQLYEQGQYTAAMQQFQKALASDPQNPDAYYNLAATTHRLGVQRGQSDLVEQAEALYNQCLDHNPNHVECYRGLAVLLADTGRPDRAFDLIKNWAAANPQNAEPRIELARLYEEANAPGQALKSLEDAVQIDATNSRAWLALGRLREQSGDPAQALQNYQQSLAINGTQPYALERVAVLTRQLNVQNDVTLSNATTQIATPAVGNSNGFGPRF